MTAGKARIEWLGAYCKVISVDPESEVPWWQQSLLGSDIRVNVSLAQVGRLRGSLGWRERTSAVASRVV